MQVGTEEASPGILTKMAVVEPPYMAPYEISAIMMNPEVGGIIVVRGNRIAIPAEGPIPGRTPISVPTRHPTNAQNRFDQVRASAKPCIRRSQEKSTLFLYLCRSPRGNWSSRSLMNR